MQQLKEILTHIQERDSRLLRQTLGRFATGVTVITTMDEGNVHGMTANAFCSVSLEPPLILIAVEKRTHMHSLLALSRRYAVSILSKDQEELARHFAGRLQEGLQVPFVWHQEYPLIEGAIAYVTCRVIDIHSAGDHMLYIGQVEHFSSAEEQAPLLFYSGKYL